MFSLNAKLLHGVRSKVNQTKWQTRISFKDQRWTGQRIQIYTDTLEKWRKETELLVDTALAHINDKSTKLKFVTLWAGKEARMYLNTLLRGEKGQSTDFTEHSRRVDQAKSR